MGAWITWVVLGQERKGLRRLVGVGNAWEAMNWIVLNWIEWHERVGSGCGSGLGSIVLRSVAIVWSYGLETVLPPKKPAQVRGGANERSRRGQGERNAFRVGAKITIQGVKGADGICDWLALWQPECGGVGGRMATAVRRSPFSSVVKLFLLIH
jgi:hypothetical protein